jgi:hypothetical protein
MKRADWPEVQSLTQGWFVPEGFRTYQVPSLIETAALSRLRFVCRFAEPNEPHVCAENMQLDQVQFLATRRNGLVSERVYTEEDGN